MPAQRAAEARELGRQVNASDLAIAAARLSDAAAEWQEEDEGEREGEGSTCQWRVEVSVEKVCEGCTDRNCLYVFMADGGGIGGTHFHLTFAGLLDNVSLSARIER